MTEFLQVEEFKKDLKKLNKKYKSLNNDLKSNFCEVLEAELPNRLPGTFRISGLGEEVKVPIYKLKHFRCKSLKTLTSSNHRVHILPNYPIKSDLSI